MIKCPKCSSDNGLQKFCGNCGAQLLADGVEFETKSNPPFNDGKLSESEMTNLYSISRIESYIVKPIAILIIILLVPKLIMSGTTNLISSFSELYKIKKRYFFATSLPILLLT
jgi:hypothetical protein